MTDSLEAFLAHRRHVASVVNRPVSDGDGPADPSDYFPPGYRTDVHIGDVDPLDLVDRSVHPVDEWGWHELRPGRTDAEL